MKVIKPMADEIDALLETVEELRARDFPDLDPQLVSDVLAVHQRFSEDRAEAKKRTEQLVSRWVAGNAGREVD
jgi:hypothetical protein